MPNILALSILVNQELPQATRYGQLGMMVAAGLIVIGAFIPLILAIVRRKKPLTRLQTLITALSAILRNAGWAWLVLCFFYFESLFPFTMLAWWLIPVPFVIWAIVREVKRYRRDVPRAQAEAERYTRYDQYLPTAKARK
jgi:amino acid transporter